MTISEAIEKLERLNLDVIVRAAISETAEEYAELNREQWAEGRASDGGSITPSTYTPEYEKTKSKEGLQTAFVDLYRTGGFYRGYTLQPDNQKILLSSDVDYEKYISKKYGPEIYGLTPENIDRYREIVRPVIMELVKQQMV